MTSPSKRSVESLLFDISSVYVREGELKLIEQACIHKVEVEEALIPAFTELSFLLLSSNLTFVNPRSSGEIPNNQNNNTLCLVTQPAKRPMQSSEAASDRCCSCLQ